MPIHPEQVLWLCLTQMADQVVILNDEQLRLLARLIYFQEVEAIKNIIFTSEPELAKCLRDSKAAFDNIVGILDAGGELKRKFKDDETRAPIAHDFFSYIVYFANMALQTVQNYTLRMNYVDKIGKHATEISNALEELDPTNLTHVRGMAEEAVEYRNAMLEFTRNHQSVASRNFSKHLKETGVKFEELVQRYQAKLNFEGLFENLEDAEKIEVYNEIIKASGRGNIIVNSLSKFAGYAGIAVILFTAGMMVWEIFSSEHVLQTATHDAVVTVASIGGASLGEVVGAALSTELFAEEASALFVLAAGIIGSIVGAFILGAFAGFLIDLIFRSGGSAPLSTDGLHCYVSPMPDGMALARQIVHNAN